MSETFEIGELVDITIRGAKVVNTYPIRRDGCDMGTVLVAEYTDGEHRNVAVGLSAPSVTVERVAPAEWPPQPGDLWRDKHEDLWFVFADPTATGALHMRTADGKRSSLGHEGQIKNNAPWRLVYRDERPPW